MNLNSYNLTVDDIAQKLGYTAQRVRTLAAEGKLPALKRFRKWLFNEQEVLEALSQLTQKSSVADDNVTDRSTDSTKAGSDLLR